MHEWRVEWDDFERHFDNWWHLVTEHKETIIITCCGKNVAAVVPWERWQEYTEQEATNA